MKSKNKWDVTYEIIDQKSKTHITKFAARGVDWRTALLVKRNNKKVCAMQIIPAVQDEEKSCHV